MMSPIIGTTHLLNNCMTTCQFGTWNQDCVLYLAHLCYYGNFRGWRNIPGWADRSLVRQLLVFNRSLRTPSAAEKPDNERDYNQYDYCYDDPDPNRNPGLVHEQFFHLLSHLSLANELLGRLAVFCSEHATSVRCPFLARFAYNQCLIIRDLVSGGVGKDFWTVPELVRNTEKS